MKKMSLISVFLTGCLSACARPSHPAPVATDISLVSDARVSEDAGAERVATVPAGSGSASGGEVAAFRVDPSTCRDASVHAARTLWRSGTMMWHLCYTTPRPRTSTSRQAGERPRRVVFTLRAARGTATHDVIAFDAPGVADPWTASVVIAVPDPPDGTPLFNVRNEYGERIESLLAVERNWNGTGLETHGVLRLWRLNRYGVSAQADFAVIANYCTELMGPEGDLAGSFFPIGAPCPEDLADCPPWLYHCPTP